jgi:AraC-like DNA-binding protein
MNAAGQLQFDHPLFDTFDLVRISHEDLDIGGRFTRNLTAINGVMSFRVRDGQGLTAREPEISVQAMRREGSLTPCYNADRYGTDITVIGDGQPQLYGFIKMLAICMQMVAGPNGTAAAHGTKGIVARGLPGTRLFTTENNVRFVLWVDAGRLERSLATWIGEPLNRALEFAPEIDWNAGPVGTLSRMISYLEQELGDPYGLTTEPVALETFTDLLVQTILRRLQHNHSPHLARRSTAAAPAHLRRADAFMLASADRPIRLADVAAAADCCLSTLQEAFRRFRDTTALGALRDIRLRCAREALLQAGDDEPTRAIAAASGSPTPRALLLRTAGVLANTQAKHGEKTRVGRWHHSGTTGLRLFRRFCEAVATASGRAMATIWTASADSANLSNSFSAKVAGSSG